jgi:hypothetical protein
VPSVTRPDLAPEMRALRRVETLHLDQNGNAQALAELYSVGPYRSFDREVKFRGFQLFLKNR